MNETIKTFASENDTDKYAVLVDNKFGLFEDKQDAFKAYESIGGNEGSDGLAETPFFAAELLVPRFKPCFHALPEGGTSRLSEHRPIDIKDYIEKRKIRSRNSKSVKWITASEKLEMKRFWDSFK